MYILLASSLPLCVIYVVYDTYILDFFIEDCLFNLYAEYIMRNAGLEETQAGIKIAGEISITSDMQMTSPL